MKKLLLSLLILACTLSFSACGKDEKVSTLSVPTELVVENQIISFNEVENASYYTIYYDGNVFSVKPSNTGEIVFDASKIFTEAKTYEIKVKAVGTGNYLDSAYSQTYEYTREQALGTPSIKLNNTTLTWATVENATSYTTKVKYPNGEKGLYTYSTNSFDIKPILYDVGEYVFQVKAGNKDDNNEFSNEITYTYSKALATPTNLSLKYNDQENELYLYFIADVSSSGFEIKVNNLTYKLTDVNFDTYVSKENYSNLLKVKLLSFLKSQNLDFENVKDFSVSVTSLCGVNDNYKNSSISATTQFNIKNVLKPVTLSIQESDTKLIISWNKIPNATSYAVYKNYEFYTSVSKDINSITFNSDAKNIVFTVQAEGVNGYLNSPMSNPVISSSLAETEKPVINFLGSTISWTGVTDVEKYVVELYNNQVYNTYTFDSNTTSINIADICDYGKYNIRLSSFITGQLSSVVEKEIDYKLILQQISNSRIGTTSSMYTITFDAVDGAIGYAVMLNDLPINKLFISNTIDLTSYLQTTGNYTVKIKAVANPAFYAETSDYSLIGDIKHSTKLPEPSFNIEYVNGIYTLYINRVDNALNYTILVNYVSVYENGVEYRESGYDITSFLTSAQSYNIMVKANANPQDPYYIDSDYKQDILPVRIQLDTINADVMDIIVEEGKYSLYFPSQSHAVNYDIRILRVESGVERKFNISTVPYEITDYMLENGTYRIYVTALPKEDDNYLYLASAESGNPLEYIKDKPSLEIVDNFSVGAKVSGSNVITASWKTVANADKYYINLYYTPTYNSALATTMVDEITVTTNYINLGDYISKEGEYTLKIKAVANSVYEASAFATFTYNHTMTVDSDFKRNTIIYQGKEYSHYVTSYTQLESLLGYYYLYNNLQYYETTIPTYYKLKIMLGAEIDNLNEQCVNENYGFENSGITLIEKLHEISTVALNNYAENLYLQNNLFSEPIEVSESGNVYYLFNFYSGLKTDKTTTITANQTNQNFEEKQNTLASSQQRNENYIFALETAETIDVTTTEQLFMAVQYGYAPNFVGNSQVAKTVYENAKNILLSICKDDMTDYDKVEAIYDWLISNVEYNYKFDELKVNSSIGDSVTSGNTDIVGNFQYEYLESVFYRKENLSATANGLSKAFVLLCQMEGIDAIKVNGTKDGIKHYWNKVYIDGTPNDDNQQKAWFSVDLASAYNSITINSIGYQLPTHRYYLVTDSYLKSQLNVAETFLPKTAVSNTSINYYSNTLYQYKKKVSWVESGSIVNKTYEGSGTLKYLTSSGTAENYIIDIMKYLVSQSNGQYNCIAEVDMSNSATALNTLVTNIKSSYYNQISTDFIVRFRVEAITYDNIIVIAVRPNS